MARYIDANELQKKLEQVAKEPDYLHEGDTWDTGVYLAGVWVDKTPTADVVEVVRCKDCKYSINLDKNCALNRNAYKHCQLWRGEELTNIWHRYKKYYKDYSIVELDGFCDSGERVNYESSKTERK